jgi:HlyD family type I secretion membrane fusion protein
MTVITLNAKQRAGSRGRTDHVADIIGAFESETAAVVLKLRPVSEHLVLYAFTFMIVLALVLAAVVKLDRVVTSVRGRTVPVGGPLYVSPFDAGIVRQLHVRVGDVVHKGQVLASLDPTFAQADVFQLRQKLASDEAAVARLEAEVAGRAYAPEVLEPSTRLQLGIWQQRQAQYRFDLADFDARIRSAEAVVVQYEADARDYSKRMSLADGIEKLYAPLLERGYVSKLQAMQATDTTTELARLLANAQSQIDSNRHLLASLRAQRESYVQKWQSDTGSALTQARNDRDSSRDGLDKAEKLGSLVSLEAPEDAVVLKIGKVSNGAVTGGAGMVGSGSEPLFTLMPLDAPLEVAIEVNAEDVGFIRVGDVVDVKLDAYRFMRHGTAKAVVKTISDGSFTTDENNSPVPAYFKIVATLKDVHLRDVPADFRLTPGMTLVGDILVGHRTILSYLVEGALRTGAEAMREP